DWGLSCGAESAVSTTLHFRLNSVDHECGDGDAAPLKERCKTVRFFKDHRFGSGYHYEAGANRVADQALQAFNPAGKSPEYFRHTGRAAAAGQRPDHEAMFFLQRVKGIQPV